VVAGLFGESIRVLGPVVSCGQLAMTMVPVPRCSCGSVVFKVRALWIH
jgi:hypothetical protein